MILQLAKKLDLQILNGSTIPHTNKDLEKEVGNIKFYSATYRLSKLTNLESDCEDYGQAVMYTGDIENHAASWSLDNHHRFEKKSDDSMLTHIICNSFILGCVFKW